MALDCSTAKAPRAPREARLVMVQKQAKQVFGLGVACRLIRYRYRRRYRRKRGENGYGWCAHLAIDKLGAVGRDDIAAPGPVGARLRATESPRPSRRSPASGLLPRAERMGWSAHLSIDKLGAVSRDDIAALGPVGARLRATESPRPSQRSPASGLLPRAERMGWSAHLSIDKLGAVSRDDIAAPGPVGARLRATESPRPSQRSPASGLLPRAERMGWCAHLSIDELGAVSRDDIAAPGPVGARLRATERPRPSRRSPASGLLPRAERMVGVHIFRSMSLGLSAEMTLPRRDR
jgi:hypothetical protein